MQNHMTPRIPRKESSMMNLFWMTLTLMGLSQILRPTPQMMIFDLVYIRSSQFALLVIVVYDRELLTFILLHRVST